MSKYKYRIDLDERGSFRAGVEDEAGNDVFTVLGGDELDEDKPSLIEDGFMDDLTDIESLETHLKYLNVIGAKDKIVRNY